ncbi:MAG: ABC transporter substrate-binding protein [Acetobacteraceae bacterium]|nr:ABC transporter substrate-binding protein [Acetobacteraceae bacterium]
MALTRRAALASALAMPMVARAQAAPVKIGLVTTLSGPGGYLGADIRDAFMLAADGGKLGGVPVQVLVEDDGLKPAQAKQTVNRFLKSEGVRLFTGVVFSNVLEAVAPDVLDDGAIYVSPNAGPSSLAGKNCNANYYVVSWQNDTLHESAGENANRLGYKKMFLLAPNYPAGKDAITGFKRFFKGEVVGESYTKLDQTDYAPEMANIRAANPDAVFQFHPGGLGIAFIRQYQQAGLVGKIPMVLAAPSLDSTILGAVGDAAIGMDVTSHWNSDFDNAANKTFVAAFVAKYQRLPTVYASQGYDTALAIGAALQDSGGNVKDPTTFRKAMLPANFQSVRGKFKFGPNQHPVQDWFGLRVEKGGDGKLALVTKTRVLTDRGDAYSETCKI